MATALPPAITDATVTLTFAGVIPGVATGHYYGYCTIADVKYEFTNLSEFPELTDATAAPAMNGNTRIAMEITGAAMELQAELDQFYVMPYTGTAAFVLLQLNELNKKLAAARIFKRFFRGAEPDMSPAADRLEQDVAAFFHSIKEGSVRWDAPWGDATSRAMLPSYDLASGLSITPSPSAADGSQNTIFTITGQTAFNRNGVM